LQGPCHALQEIRSSHPVVRVARSAAERPGPRGLQRRNQQATRPAAAALASARAPRMRFDVLAVDARQQIVALELEAANPALAAEEVRSQGLSLVSLESRGVRLSLARRKRFPATLFSMELVSLLDAGLNLVEALQTLAEKEGYGER